MPENIEKNINLNINAPDVKQAMAELEGVRDATSATKKESALLQKELGTVVKEFHLLARSGKLSKSEMAAFAKAMDNANKSVQDSVKEVGKLTKAYKFVSNGVKKLGSAFKGSKLKLAGWSAALLASLNHLSSYSKESLSAGRVTSMLGGDMVSTQKNVEATGNALGMNRKESMALFNEFARGATTISGSDKRFAQMANTLESRLGPNIEEIKKGMADLSALYQKNMGLASAVESGFDAGSEAGMGYYIMLTKVEGMSHQQALSMMEMANGFRELTAEEVKQKAEQEENIRTQQELEAALKDAALVITEILQPALKGAADIVTWALGKFIEFKDDGIWAIEKAVGHLKRGLGLLAEPIAAVLKKASGIPVVGKWFQSTADKVYDYADGLRDAGAAQTLLADTEYEAKKQAKAAAAAAKNMNKGTKKSAEEIIIQRRKESQMLALINKQRKEDKKLETYDKATDVEKAWAKKKLELLYKQSKARKESFDKQNTEYQRITQLANATAEAEGASREAQMSQIQLLAAIGGSEKEILELAKGVSASYDKEIAQLEKVKKAESDRLAATVKDQEAILKEMRAMGESQEKIRAKEEAIKVLKKSELKVQSDLNRAIDVKKYEKIQQVMTATLAGLEKQAQYASSITNLKEAEMSLQEKLYFGVGATLKARLDTVAAVEKEIAVKDKMIAEMKREAATQKQGSEAHREYLIKINQMETERLSLISKQVDLTKELREGYLSAIESFEYGAGEFDKIIAKQDFGTRQLMERTGMAGAMALGGMGQGLQAPQMRFRADMGMGGALTGQAATQDQISKMYYGGKGVGYGPGRVGTAIGSTSQQQSAFESIGKEIRAGIKEDVGELTRNVQSAARPINVKIDVSPLQGHINQIVDTVRMKLNQENSSKSLDGPGSSGFSYSAS